MIDEKQKQELYEKAYKKWGYDAQLGMLFEEMAELIVVLNKQRRTLNGCPMEKVIDEIADVEIMLEQYRYMSMIEREHIDKKKQEKLLRLKSMLEGNQKKEV